MVLSATVSQSGTVLGRLVGRGAFDAHTAYSPGEVVIASSIGYVNILAVGNQPYVSDSFVRADAARWGLTQDGQQWNPYVQGTDEWVASIVNGVGVLFGETSAAPGGTLLLDRLSTSTDREVLAQIRLDADTEPGDAQVGVVLASDTDEQNMTYALVYRTDDGHLTVDLNKVLAGTASNLTTDATTEDPGVGTLLWLRVRRVGSTLTVTLWQDGEAEPTAPLLSQAADTSAWGHQCGVAYVGAADSQASVGYFSARVVSTGGAPGSTTAHWTALTDAFPLNQPY